MNKKLRRQLFAKLAGVMLLGGLACGVAQADNWKALIIPASLNAGNVVELVSDEVQPISFALQAIPEIVAQGEKQPLVLEWDLPQGMQIISQAGLFELSNAVSEEKDGRTLTRYEAQIPSRFIAGAPGSRLGGEGINHSLFIRVSQAVPVEQRVIRLKIKDSEAVQTFEWPLSLRKLVPPAQYPKRTPLTLWDYNYSRATTPEAAQGIAQLFKHSGIGFTQAAADATYRSALEAQGIATGGYVHHSAFHSKEYPDYNAAGKQLSGSLAYADPQSIITLPAGAEIPGVKQLLAAAKLNGGYATFDYEPNGLEGFSPASVKVFKERYSVSDEEFEKFREYVAKNALQTHLTQDEGIARNWRRWGEFRSEQTSNYMRRIYEAVKAQNADVRVVVTPSRTAGKDSLGSYALGTDNSAMARYTDIIMPQLYSGYGGAQAKQVLQLTEAWHREIEQQKNGTRLWPLLLVRYSGATVFNSPERLRQQIIGTLAYGAHGVGFYYPGNMDGTYWEMLARTTEDIAKYEDFYQDGVDVSEQFKLSGLPINEVKIPMFPSYQDTIINPGWAFKAHRLNNRVLLTLINLEEANDLRFGVEIGKSKALSTQNAEADGKDGWVVKAKQVGFVVLANE